MNDVSDLWDHTIRQAYREAVHGSGESGVSKQDAIDRVVEHITPFIADGSLAIPPHAAIRQTIDTADRRDGARADQVLRAAANGHADLGIEGDPLLEIVVTLGSGHRKSWQWVDRHDLIEMDRIRYRNLENSSRAYSAWRRVYEPWLMVLDRRKYFGEAIEVQDLPEIDPADAGETVT